MLFELYIKDFILIDEARIPFNSGFNVLTGETGAGKSMIIGALNLILGASASKEMIRLGSEAALIKASFDMEASLNLHLEAIGIEADQDVLTISREIQAKGKSVARINGQICTIAQLKNLSSRLVDIHGQMDNQELLNRENQLLYLDVYCGKEHLNDVTALETLYKEIKLKQATIDALTEKVASQSREEDFIKFQIEEIENAKLKEAEDVALEKQFEFYTHTERIVETLGRLGSWLSGEYGDGAVSTLSKFSSDLQKLSEYDDAIALQHERLKEAYFVLEDLSKEVSGYNDRLEQDPETLNQIQLRLDEINRLKSKYGKTVEAILEYCTEQKEALSHLSQIGDTLEVEKQAYEALLNAYEKMAQVVSQKRLEMAPQFSAALIRELKDLNLPDVAFEIQFTKVSLSAKGQETAEFQIATNSGQPLRAMHKVVSGGELSRIMLAIKVLVGEDALTTMVFDEIDSGISGQTAHVVGEKLAYIAKGAQVISITHLPQIAVFGDQNFKIEKFDVNQVTKTSIEVMDHEAKTLEIIRLVGGNVITEATKQHAEQMIAHAVSLKASQPSQSMRLS